MRARQRSSWHGRAFASVELCQCEDGLWRYALHMQHGHGGFGFPIAKKFCDGHPNFNAATDAATDEILKRFPSPWPGDPQSVHDELREMRATIERAFAEPTLF